MSVSNLRWALLLVLMFTLAGCGRHVQLTAIPELERFEAPLTIYDHPLLIHLSRPLIMSGKHCLVIYATGDGGWRGLDRQLFDWISRLNYPVAGFSSKDYLENLRYVSDSDTTTPRRLTRDFENIIDFAERKLGLPASTRIILIGLSRGAGLSVVAAGQGGISGHLAGLVAIALTKEEEHVVRYRRNRGAPRSGKPNREPIEIKTYDYLPRISSIPVAVIQSENDGYLPARNARALFGADTERRRLLPVKARNHGFSGGRNALQTYLGESLRWIQGTF